MHSLILRAEHRHPNTRDFLTVDEVVDQCTGFPLLCSLEIEIHVPDHEHNFF